MENMHTQDTLSFIPLGGIGNVTRNMYVYAVGNEILLVDCGLGFPDDTLPGVDFLIPDISYLKQTDKKIVGMVLTHGHEDHIGALPLILPQLPEFPIYASKLTAAFANEKLKEAEIQNRQVQTVSFNDAISVGIFSVSFVRITHSILDAANLLIKSPVGTFYHASDFKFDFTPVDGNPSDLGAIASAGNEGITCLMSDCLGSERQGYTPSEMMLYESFEEAFQKTKGKVFLTTYSSNISRLNQAIETALKFNRKICFMGRSLLKARDIGRSLSYMKYPNSLEINPNKVRHMNPSSVLILVAGSQAQEGSALVRIANDEDRDLTINKNDTVIFSADPIPGNEAAINSLVDTIAKKGARVVYSNISDEFHVSGHGSAFDLKLMMALTKPKFVLPISGTYRQMVAYRDLARSMGYADKNIIFAENGQEFLFGRETVQFGKKRASANIFVDEMTGKKIDHFLLVDRLKISQEGIMVVIAEVEAATGQLLENPDILTRGFVYENRDKLSHQIAEKVHAIFRKKQEQVTNWVYIRDTIRKKTEEILVREGREPLVIPVVLEV